MARPRFDSRVYRRGLPGDVDAPGFGHRYSCKAGAPAPAEPAGVSHGTATGKQDPRPCAGGVGWAGAPPRRLPGDRGAAGDPVARRRSHRAPGRDHADPRQRLRAGRRLPPRRGHPHRPRAAPRDQLLHRPGAGRRPAVQRRERAPGRCGKASLDAIELRGCALPSPGPRVDAEVIYGLPDKLREAQGLFESTGGLHAAGLFTPEGELECLREDVGRHNAVDKLVGWALLEGRLPLADRILLVSGRASFEIMQKALAAGVPMVCAVSAPSSLAVDVAERFGMTLAGFLRGRRFNLYTGPDRVLLPTPAEHSS